MNLLLLHPEDNIEQLPWQKWDLVIDLARAPASCYQRWSRITGGSVMSLYDFSREVEDLHCLRGLLAIGMGRVLDRWGLDWWDIASLDISDRLLQLVLIARLEKTLPSKVGFFASRSSCLAEGLAGTRTSRITLLPNSRLKRVRQAARHYAKVLSESDTRQLVQTAFDKFDPQHRVRRQFAPEIQASTEAVVLAPSAYINVSRTVVRHAQAAADQNFVLVYARSSGRLEQLPRNMRSEDLSAFFGGFDPDERRQLLAKWNDASAEIAGSAPELRAAAAAGIFNRVSQVIIWGSGIRDAWNRVLDSHHVVSCFCADDSNPYTRIPLMLCKARGIPATACHHGALDFRMAFKRRHADRYLAKTELELDYLREVCGLDPGEITPTSHVTATRIPFSPTSLGERDWLVYFTEPYAVGAWRSGEVHATILPELARLARQTGLRLILKLHPFESVRHFRKLAKRLLSKEERAQTQIISAPLDPEQWARTRFAVAVESSVAIECTQRGIPIFLMSWLRNRSYGYVRQFQKFKVGQVLHELADIASIPGRLQALESQSSSVAAGEETGNGYSAADRPAFLVASGRY